MAKKKTSTKNGSAKSTPAGELPTAHRRSGRPSWQGHLRLSLVACPVALYAATTRVSDVSFHLLNPDTNNRIRMVPTDPDEGPVERSKLVKGYEIAKNKYVIVTDEELDEVKLETTHTLDIERFVDESEIDRLYWSTPYYLVPDGDMGVEAFAVIRDAMKDAGRVALGRVTMHTRERLMALEPRGKGIVATTLRMANEVVNADAVFRDIPDVHPAKQMTHIAEQIIAQQEGAFEPKEFRDRYEEALKALIQSKEKGESVSAAPPPKDTSNVVDLMDALRKSLQAKGKPMPPAVAKASKRPRTQRGSVH